MRQLEIVNFILRVIFLPFSVWFYFSCGTVLSSGLNINAEILEGKHSNATVDKEED